MWVNKYKEENNMLFSEIIRESGSNPSEFKKCSDIPVVLYDGKDRINSEKTIHFVEPLFSKNPNSLRKFNHYLSKIEMEPVESINVQIDIDSVILFYKTPQATVFSRRPCVYIPTNME